MRFTNLLSNCGWGGRFYGEPKGKTAIAALTFLNGFFDALLCLFWADAGPGMRLGDAISSILQQIGQLAPLRRIGPAERGPARA
jgi:hypothetical protein